MNGKRILVAGGLGYIGSHTTVELSAAGFDVLIADNLSNSDLRVLPAIQALCITDCVFREIELSDQSACDALFEEYDDIVGVIHFAASKAVGESVEKPLQYYANNLGSLMCILRAMARNSITPLIFSSSCTVYGQPQSLPVTESSPVMPAESPYGNTKKMSEDILRDVCHGKEMPLDCIALRYFNPIGAHASGTIGELPAGVPANLLPYVMQTASGERDHLRIWGNDYPTPDGTAIRDYIHVVDLAKAHVVATQRILRTEMEKNFEIFNIGTGKGHSVLEVVKSVSKAVGKEVPYKIYDRRAGDIVEIYASTDRANEVLGWQAEMELDDMCSSAWKWEQYRKVNL